jgi:hypothetical protein
LQEKATHGDVDGEIETDCVGVPVMEEDTNAADSDADVDVDKDGVPETQEDTPLDEDTASVADKSNARTRGILPGVW